MFGTIKTSAAALFLTAALIGTAGFSQNNTVEDTLTMQLKKEGVSYDKLTGQVGVLFEQLNKLEQTYRAAGDYTSLLECMLLKEQIIAGIQGETGVAESDLKDLAVGYSENGKAYAFINKPVSWWKAQSICRQLGGELLTPRTDADLDVIRKLAQAHGGMWLNATDIVSEGTWITLNGEPITATAWRYNEPNNVNGGEHFAMTAGHGWNDILHSKLPFVCVWQKTQVTLKTGLTDIMAVVPGMTGKSVILLRKNGDLEERFFEPAPNAYTRLATQVSAIGWYGNDAIAIGFDSGKVELRNHQTNKVLKTFTNNTSPVRHLEIVNEGAKIACITDSNQLIIWEVRSQKQSLNKRLTRKASCLALSPDGKTVCVGYTRPAEAELLDAKTGKSLHRLRGHMFAIRDVAFHPSGKHVYTASNDMLVKCWQLNNPVEGKNVVAHSSPVKSIQFYDDGQLITCSIAGNIITMNPSGVLSDRELGAPVSASMSAGTSVLLADKRGNVLDLNNCTPGGLNFDRALPHNVVSRFRGRLPVLERLEDPVITEVIIID